MLWARRSVLRADAPVPDVGERLWLSRARDLGEQAVGAVQANALRRDSLYKGEIGVAALLADLDRPDDAAMPFYDRDPWPRTAGAS